MKIKPLSRILIIMGVLLALTYTQSGASTNNWSRPENLSDWQLWLADPRLLRGQDGTQVVYWMNLDTILSKQAFWVRLRPPGGEWSAVQNVFGWVDYGSLLPELDVAQDGTVWVLWAEPDKAQTGDNIQVKVASWTGSGAWQHKVLSDYESDIRSIDLFIGPDGHIAATWVPCSSSTADEQGPCDVSLRCWNPGPSDWETIESVDATVSGIISGRSLVGPAGMIVTTWAEASLIYADQWHVMARAFDPSKKMWDSFPKDISSGEFKQNMKPFLPAPVMGADGTVIAIWYQGDTMDDTKAQLWSTTRPASTKTWNTPTQISTVHKFNSYNNAKLTVGQNGAVVAAWIQEESGKSAVYANRRDPGGIWAGVTVRVSELVDSIDLAQPQVWPNGSSILVWEVVDGTRAITQDTSLFWSARAPNSAWGDLGQGQLGGWVHGIHGVSLAAANDGSITAVWGVRDSSLPANQQGVAYAASWIPGAGPIPITTLSSGDLSVVVNQDNVVVSGDGQTRAAAWFTGKFVEIPGTDPDGGVFYSQSPPDYSAPSIYLPFIRKSKK